MTWTMTEASKKAAEWRTRMVEKQRTPFLMAPEAYGMEGYGPTWRMETFHGMPVAYIDEERKARKEMKG